MTLLTEQAIRDTLTSYADHDNNATAYDELMARMHEVKSQIETARCLLHSAKLEIPQPLTHPAFEAVVQADAHLGFALTAWD